MTDTHAHLDACDEPAATLVERARVAEVMRIVTIGTGSVQPFFPTPRNALSLPAGTIVCPRAHAARKLVMSSGSVLLEGKYFS